MRFRMSHFCFFISLIYPCFSIGGLVLKKFLLSLLLIIAVTAGVIYNIPGVFVHYGADNVRESSADDVKQGVSYVELLQKRSSDEVQKKIDEVEKAKEEAAAQVAAKNEIKMSVENSIKKIESGKLSYMKVFKDVYIAGDSLVHGLKEYNIINPSHLITEVSASLYHLESNYSKIVGLKPQILILHYGLNMAEGSQERCNAFISQYTGIISRFKKDLPETRIIISQIFPIKKGADTYVKPEYIVMYNKAIEKMCKKLGVETLDSIAVFKVKDLYEDDGIHQKAEFYYLWLKHIMREKEIY